MNDFENNENTVPKPPEPSREQEIPVKFITAEPVPRPEPQAREEGTYSFKREQVPFGSYGGAPVTREPEQSAPQPDRIYGAPTGSEPRSDKVYGAQPAPEERQSGYNRFRDNAEPGYVDANYRTQEQERGSGFTYGTYYTPPQAPKRKKDKVRKEKKAKNPGGSGSSGFLKAACLCLVCALLGGLAGGILVASRIPENSHVSGNLNVSTPQVTTTPEAQVVADGSTLTGAQIYSLGCDQVVGVTTEVSYKNYFGMQYSYPISGSGFIVTENGYVVTNYHVVADAYKGGYDIDVLLYNGDTFDAEIVGVREEYDLAVLKIDAENLSAAILGDSSTLKVGDPAYAIGNPLGELNFTMTSGHVSALDRSITTTDKDTGTTTTNTMFQIDAAINQGNSGGPVYNEKGEVVGIVTAKYADTGVEGLGFAIPMNSVIDLINQFVEVGYVSGMPSFGIMLGKDVDSATASYFNMAVGAYVQEVIEGSCSEKAGMKAGDIITAVDGKEVSGREELANIKKNYRAGDTVTVTVFRDGESIELEVTFDEETVTVNKPQGKVDTLPIVPKK